MSRTPVFAGIPPGVHSSASILLDGTGQFAPVFGRLREQQQINVPEAGCGKWQRHRSVHNDDCRRFEHIGSEDANAVVAQQQSRNARYLAVFGVMRGHSRHDGVGLPPADTASRW